MTFSGYGIFIVKSHTSFSHDVTTLDGIDESTLGFYTGGHFDIYGEGLHLAAQILVNGSLEVRAGTTIYGSLTATGYIELVNGARVIYRPASPALTEPFWPMNGQ